MFLRNLFSVVWLFWVRARKIVKLRETCVALHFINVFQSVWGSKYFFVKWINVHVLLSLFQGLKTEIGHQDFIYLEQRTLNCLGFLNWFVMVYKFVRSHGVIVFSVHNERIIYICFHFLWDSNTRHIHSLISIVINILPSWSKWTIIWWITLFRHLCSWTYDNGM